jgi:hypothetical protein
VQQPAGEAMEKKKECNIRWPKKCIDLNIRETKKKTIAYGKPRNPPARKTIAIITL